MIHSFIAPTSYLHFIPQSVTLHLVLAHLFNDNEYVNFYRAKQLRGDTIIMDNGAFEFKIPLSMDELANICDKAKFQPNIIVAPDYPFTNYIKTINSTEQFCREYKARFDKSVKVMCVPQSEQGDFDGWYKAYRIMCEFDEIEFVGMSILGIPNAICHITQTKDVSFNRTYLTELLKSHQGVNDHVKHHYLGCDSPRELLMMKTQGVAYSNDSSTAIWHGILSVKFDDTASGLWKGKNPTPVDFTLPYDPNNDRIIDKNIQWIGNLLGVDYY
jgi:hypothetical protein